MATTSEPRAREVAAEALPDVQPAPTELRYDRSSITADAMVMIAERRVGEGYRMERLTEGKLVSSSEPGFWMDLSWKWADPLPKARRCLEAILAGPPA
jgi:hypothetical protein